MTALSPGLLARVAVLSGFLAVSVGARSFARASRRAFLDALERFITTEAPSASPVRALILAGVASRADVGAMLRAVDRLADTHPEIAALVLDAVALSAGTDEPWCPAPDCTGCAFCRTDLGAIPAPPPGWASIEAAIRAALERSGVPDNDHDAHAV